MSKRCAIFIACLFLTSSSFANLRDPTHPPYRAEFSDAEVSASDLQAIIISENHRVAMIAGKPLHLGSHFAGFTVMAIQPNAVHLEGPDGKMVLFLFNQTIKKPARLLY